MIREVAHGNTTIARTALRQRNLLFSTRARMKPKTVEITTTATVHTIVLCNTSLKVEPLRTLVKLSSPQKPLIRPALLTYLTHRSTENFKDRKEDKDRHKQDAGEEPEIRLYSSKRFLFFHILHHQII